MISKNKINIINSFNWEKWLDRDFPIFVPYQMQKGATKRSFLSQDIDGEYPILLFQNGAWWECENMHELGDEQAKKYFEDTNIPALTKKCEILYSEAKIAIQKMLVDKTSRPIDQFRQVVKLTEPINVYVWLAHTGELHLKKIIEREIGRKMKEEERERFIGDISLPSKKNAHTLMEEDMRNDMPLPKLLTKYAWIKTRRQGGFSKGYTMEEMEQLKKEVTKTPKKDTIKTKAPRYLKGLAKEMKSLVYLRTFRTDALFELYYLAKPIFYRLERELKIDSVGNYLPEDLINKNLNKYKKKFAILKYYDEIIVSNDDLIIVNNQSITKIKGQIAQKGKAIGVVKILFQQKEVNKICKGDILVTNMTIPAYLPAMKRASAFITDEGGITCHASIIARELKKPCIIGTKNATQILKDGDLVEVDAIKGIVKILKK